MAGKKKKLTAKQEKFVEEYLVDLNATRAYKAAYPATKTDNAAAASAVRLLRDVKIQEAIQNRRQILAKNTITPEKVVEEWMKIAGLDIKDFLSWRTQLGVVGYTEDGQPVFDFRPVIELKDSEHVDGTLVQEVSISEKGVFKFKLHDRMKALENIAKHLGMFVEKQEISGPGGGPIEIDLSGLTLDELRRLAASEED